MFETCRVIKRFYAKELKTDIKVRGRFFFLPLNRDERFILSENVVLDYKEGRNWQERIADLKNFYEKHLNEEGWNKEKIERQLKVINEMFPIWEKYFK